MKMAKCELCGSNRDDAEQYGEILSKGGMSVHTYCLYLSSNLAQKGKDDEGFLGFLQEDIRTERERAASVRCCYCGCMGANVGCCARKCRRSFHTICGIENFAMNQFFGTYRSYCNRHVRKIPYRPSPNDICSICYDQIHSADKRFTSVTMLFASCCRNGWFHKLCMQRFANTAGYFFKCPLCNNRDVFRRNVSLGGIFIPERDAAWELEPNAYEELLERPNRCAAEHCSVPGRSGSGDALLLCETCGSVAMHRRCMPNARSQFQCENCRQLLTADSGRESMQSLQEVENCNGNEEDIELDVCGHSDAEKEDTENGALQDSVTQLSGEEKQQQDEAEVESDVGRAQVARLRKRYINRMCSSDDDDDDSDAAAVERKRKKCKRKTALKTRRLTDTDDTSTDDDEFIQFDRKHLSKASYGCNGEGTIGQAAIKHIVLNDTTADSDDPLENVATFMDKLRAKATIMDKLRAKATSDDNSVKVSTRSNQTAATPICSDDSEDMNRRLLAKKSKCMIIEDSADEIDESLNNASRRQMASSLESQTGCQEYSNTNSRINALSIRNQVVVKLKKLPARKTVPSTTPAKRPRLRSTDSDTNDSLLNVSCIARRTRRRSNVTPSSASLNMSFIAQRTRYKSTTRPTPNRPNYAELAAVESDIDSYTEDTKTTVSANDGDSINISAPSVRNSSAKSFYSCSSTSAITTTTTTSTALSATTDERSPVTVAHKSGSHSSAQRRLVLPASDENGLSSFNSNTSTHRISARFAANLHCIRNKIDAYLMPRFARIDGKLRRISDDNTLENHAHNKFVRSCRLMLNANSENRQRQFQDQHQEQHRSQRHMAHALRNDCKSL